MRLLLVFEVDGSGVTVSRCRRMGIFTHLTDPLAGCEEEVHREKAARNLRE